MANHKLNFDLIDDILNLDPDEYVSIARDSTVETIGPLVEYIYHSPRVQQNSYTNLWPDSVKVQALHTASKTCSLNDAVNSISGLPKQFEFIPTPRRVEDVLHPKWTSFLIRAQKAAEDAGIQKPLAQAMIGTLEEMADNIIWHSRAVTTGVCGYNAHKNFFEYVIADAGEGVFKTLRTNPRWESIGEPLEALEKAIESGVTRCWNEPHRGMGFNNLIRNIAKYSCFLRFHSDNACITFDGILAQTTGSIRQTNFKAPAVSGFVISVFWQVI